MRGPGLRAPRSRGGALIPGLLALAGVALAGSGVGAPPPDLAEVTGPRKVALVVGLNRYQPEAGLHDLRFAAADAEAVGDRLEEAGYRVSRLLDTSTRAGFERAFTEATADLQRDDLFVLYFAGHAQLEAGADETELALLFSDDDGTDGDGMRVEELSERIDGIGARHRVVLLDTCYSERTQQQLASSRGAPVLGETAVGRFDAWIFSAAPRQSAQEDEELGHGVFTWFLLQALDGAADVDGDGTVGVLEIYNWVGFKTAERTGRAQVPWIEESRIGWNDLGLVTVDAAGPKVAIPWYEQVIPGATVLLDGLTRGPGSAEAGRHELEVRGRDGELLLRRTIDARGGDVLDWSDWLHASGSRVRLGAGLGFVGSPRVAPALGGELTGWWLPASPRSVRLALGATGNASKGDITPDGQPIEVDVYTASARAGGFWMTTPAVSVGPWLGAGAGWRVEPKGIRTTPLGELGLAIQAEAGPLWVGVEGGARTWTIEGWSVAPVARVQVGATLR